MGTERKLREPERERHSSSSKTQVRDFREKELWREISDREAGMPTGKQENEREEKMRRELREG